MSPNELLLWMSARGTGSWSQFRAMVNDLGLDENDAASGSTFLPHQRLRANLETLAHVQFEHQAQGNGWRVSAPVLALARPGGQPVGFLYGARTQPLLARLRAASPTGTYAQTEITDSPDAIRITASETVLAELAASTSVGFQADAAANLLARLAPIEKSALGPEKPMPFGRDVKIERFVVERKHCRWEEISSTDAKERDGLYRCTRWQVPEHFLRLNGRTRSTAGQAGKYFVLRGLQRRVLRYDAATRQLRVPAICRPPRLVDRALTLCSGFPPREENVRDRKFLLYSEVDSAVTGLVAEILRQPLP